MSLVEKLKQRRLEEGSMKFFELSAVPLELWSPPKKKGKATIRILPPTKAMNEAYYVEYYAHFGLGANKKDLVLCGRQFNDTCPICDVVSELYDLAGDDESLRKKARRVKASQKFLVHLLDLDDEKAKKKVKIGMLSSSVEQQVTSLIIGDVAKEDEEDDEVQTVEPLGDVTHWARGYNLVVFVNPKALPMDYYKVRAFKSPSPIAKDKESARKILAQRVDLDAMLREAASSPSTLEAKARQLRKVMRLDSEFSERDEDEDETPKKKKGRREREHEEADGDDLPF